MSLDHRDVVVAGVRSHVLTGGPADAAEAVLFVHGNPGSSEDWRSLAEDVSSFARVVAPDMPGFGKSDKTRGFGYTVDAYVDFLEGLLASLGIQRVHLVLHDFGGPWSLAWAARRPAPVGSVVLLDTGALMGDRWHSLAKVYRTRGAGEVAMATTTRTAFRIAMKQGNPRGLPRNVVDRMYDDFDRDTRRAVLKVYRSADAIGERASDVVTALRDHDIPALVLWGRHDPYVDVDLAERQREAFPSAKVVVLDDSGHWPFADIPEAVAAEVVPSLREQLPVS